MNKLVLIGGGHAHLIFLRELLATPIPHEIILISADPYQYYSGMFSGFTEGLYGIDDIRIPIEKLCQENSVEFIVDTIIEVDPINKTAKGISGQIYPFDVVSINIGSSISELLDSTTIKSIKPNYQFPDIIDQFRSGEKPVIIGGGSAGLELALTTTAWRKNNNQEANVTLISASRLLSSYGTKGSTKIRQVAKRKGLEVIENETVEHLQQNVLTTKRNQRIEWSHLLSLTGPIPSPLFKENELLKDEKGFLLVNSTLQHNEYPFVFGAGDCVTVEEYPLLPKNGVYAVRQGHLLVKNLKAYLENQEKLLHFTPQKRFLSILSTGNQEGLLTYGSFYFHGKISWKIKHYIDKQFMHSFHY
ncbi:FAD-dependent oxidoreductase [Jeotgalibaca sp. MA1X17-3]|uniref:FAD-dependent oxidoreductase n=1 Tax=Jeotgalibaca sp. MA1X17-3 TaxID=2908211 RepID=UPI001F301EFF|nr:FAD-dependent oxidoreductase [Jeotgalibaca sp. MA1X17-3]UJF16026.1 FAD-dependent oxidoreductase [Jeotgalibaca sp. MA1X17-3]